MECSEVRQRLDAYLEHRLAEDEMRATEEHLFHCDGCWQEMTSLQELHSALADSDLQAMVLHEPSPLPEDFTQHVMARIHDERPTGVTLIWPWLRRKWSSRQYASVAYAMSATMVVFSAGNMLYLWNQTTDRLGVWSAQGQAYWDALQAHLAGMGAYFDSVWTWLSALL